MSDMGTDEAGSAWRPRMNPSLDTAALAETYRSQDIVQIPDFLDPDSAERLARAMSLSTPWDLALPSAAGEQQTFTFSKLDETQAAAVKARMREVFARARTDFSYVYLTYQMGAALEEGRDPDLDLHRFTEFVNGDAFLDFGRTLIGEPGVVSVDAHATNYRPGDFLSVHDDRNIKRDRFAAYTFGLTRGWRPDWGGQLLFHDDAGDVVRGLMPRFNVLTVFRVPRPHSVAPVALYAGAPRFTITGWLRASRALDV